MSSLRSRRVVAVIAGAAVVVLAAGWAIARGAGQNAGQGATVVMHANSVNQKATLAEAYRDAEIALIAVPVAVESYKLHAMVFTDYTVRVVRHLKGRPPSDLRVTLTGGDWQGVAYRVEQLPMLEVGRPYRMLLHKQFPDDPDNPRYTPVGGYQGLIQLTEQIQPHNGNTRWMAVTFNPDNAIEAQVRGRDVLAALGQSQ